MRTTAPEDEAGTRRGRRCVPTCAGDGTVGWLGLEEQIEPLVRREVAAHFGVASTLLGPGTSLAGDHGRLGDGVLAVAGRIERRLGLALPEGGTARVRTYADLVDVVMRACAHTAATSAEVVFARVRITCGGRAEGPWTERQEWLTPYLVETVVDEAARLGSGTRIDVWVPADTAWGALARACGRLARLTRCGADSRVHRVSGRSERHPSNIVRTTARAASS